MANLHKECENWFACRIFHNKIKLVKEQLTYEGIQFFIPIRITQKESPEGFTYLEQPVIPSLVFIRTTETYLRNLKERYTAHLSIYMNPGTRKAAVVPNREMEIFMFVLSKGCHQLESVDEKLVQGNHVRITGGLFKGAEGYITRIHGTKRFVVLIKGVAAVATTFVPRCFIETIE